MPKVYMGIPTVNNDFGPTTTSEPTEGLMNTTGAHITFEIASGSSPAAHVLNGHSANTQIGDTANVVSTPTEFTEWNSDTTWPKPPTSLIRTAPKFNAWRYGPLNFIIPEGVWNYSGVLYAISSNGVASDITMLWRIFKGTLADGSDAQPIGDRWVSDTYATTIASKGQGIISGNAGMPELEFSNEYLFFAIAVKVGPGVDTNSARSLQFRRSPNFFVEYPATQPMGQRLIGMVGI